MKNRFTILILFLAGVISCHLQAQLIVPFTQRTSPSNPGVTIYNVRGDFSMLGNSNLTLQNYGDNTGNSNTMVYVDVDNDPSTLNSSSANLVFSSENGSSPSCSEVIYAGLYWTGRAHDAANSPNTFSVTKNGVTVNYDKQIVKLKGPSAPGYTNITATSTDIYYPQGSEGLMYSAYAEITDYVQNNGVQGMYTVADIALAEGFGGSTGFYGGWGMVVIYGNNQMNLRDITVFDGHAYVAGGVTADFTIPLSGFNSSQSGPVNVKMGMIAGEGDRNIAGDYFQIRNASNTAWVDLTHGGNATNNFFNSSVFTGGNPRNPALLNNTGLDICTFSIPNTGNSVIANNQTSTTFRYGTTQDTYVIFSIVFGVDAYEPEIAGVNSLQTINGVAVSTPPVALPGESLQYQLDILNTGNEPITNGQIVIPLPYNATFESTSGQYLFTPNSGTTPYFDPTIGSNGSIVWNIGDLPLPSSPTTVLAQLNYTLNATEECLLLSNANCESTIEVNGTITGLGAVTNSSLSETFISGFQQSGNCAGLPITTPVQVLIDGAAFVEENCSGLQTDYSFIFCGLDSASNVLPTNQISGSFPVGTRFFDSNPVTTTSIEYTNLGFPIVYGTSTYYAYPQGTDAPCFIEFTITMIDSVLTSVPNTNDVVYCLNDVAQPINATPSNPNYSIYYYSSFPGGTPTGQIIPTTTSAGVTTFYAVEALSNTCISSNAAEIDVTVLNNSPSSLSGINGSSVYSASTTPGNEVCFDVVAINADPNQIMSVTYNNGISNATFNYSQNTSTGTFCWTPGSNETGVFTFELTVTDACGGSSTSSYEVIVEGTPCEVQVSLESYNNLLCSNNDGTAMVLANGGAAPYVFTLINTTSGEIFTNNTGIFTNLTSGEYSVVVSDSNNCQPVCTDLDFNITGSVSNLTSSVNTTLPLCTTASSSASISVTANGGTPGYLYSIGGPFVSSNSFSGLADGTYSVTVMDINGCSVTASVTISSPAPLTASLDGAQQALCGQNNGSFIVNVSGGTLPYQLLLNGNPVTQGAVTSLAAGTYNLSVVDANNCSTTASAIISAPNALSALIAGIQQPNCVTTTGSFSVQASGGTAPYTYSLGNGINASNDFTNLQPGQYSVIVTDATNCTASTSVTINAPQALNAALTNIVSPTCGSANGGATVNVTSGTAPYQFSVNGANVSSNVLTGLGTGSYTVVVTDANLCTETLTLSLDGTPSFTITTTQTPVTCFGSCDGSVSVTGSATPLQYAWSNGASGANLTDLCAGTYTVTATDANGCQQTASVLVTEPASLNLTVISTTNETCNQNDGAVVLAPTGGTAPYTFYLAGSSQTNVLTNTTGTFNGLSSGGYAYYMSDANGCELECLELVFITDDCGQVNGSKTSAQNGTSSPYLLLSPTKEVGGLVVNYAGGNESALVLSFIAPSGDEVMNQALPNASGAITFSKEQLKGNASFVVLKTTTGTILGTAKIKK
jgi:hypothetical protein